MTKLSDQIRCFNPTTGESDGGYCVWQGGGKCLKCQAADAIDGQEQRIAELTLKNREIYEEIEELALENNKLAKRIKYSD